MVRRNNAYQGDVLIIGAGIAGLVTALELLDHNKKVIILERDNQHRIGGLAREAFGGMMIVDSPQQRKMGIKDSPELAFSDWLRVAVFGPEDQWPVKWAETYVSRSVDVIYEWLAKHSIKFLPIVAWAERGLHCPANTVPRWLITWGTGRALVTSILKHINQHPQRGNLEIFFNHRVSHLNHTNGVVNGCSGVEEENGHDFTAEAECVIAAAGGVSGGRLEKVYEHWPAKRGKPPDTLLNGSHRYADGLLHDLIATLGGKVTYLDRHWHYASGIRHPHPDRYQHGLSIVPPRSALWVNAVGKRIGPVPLVGNTDTAYLVDAVCHQPGQYTWQIMNWKIAIKELAVSGSEYMTAYREKRKKDLLSSVLFGNKKLVQQLISESQDFVTAENIPALICAMNAMDNAYQVDADLLTSEIKAYDDQISRGISYFNDDQLRRIANMRKYRGDRLRTCKFQRINDEKAKPLIAIREFILSRKSLGGVQTDLQCRVLDQVGAPIPGLYAVGECAGFGGGGIHGERSLEGTFLSSCILTGRMAAGAISGKSL